MNIGGRLCSIYCYGPWAAEDGLCFIRVNFHFPKQYPKRAAPTVTLDKHAEVTLKQRAFLLRGLREVLSKNAAISEQSLEACIRFLLGENEEEGIDGSSSDSDLDVRLAHVDRQRRINVPLPRTSGAVFGPRGELIYFTPLSTQSSAPNGSTSVNVARSMSQSRSPTRQSATGRTTDTKSRRGMFETFGVLDYDPHDSTSASEEDSDDILRSAIQRKARHQVRLAFYRSSELIKAS